MIYAIRARTTDPAGQYVRDRTGEFLDGPARSDVPTLFDDLDRARRVLALCPDRWWPEVVTIHLSWSNTHGGHER